MSQGLHQDEKRQLERLLRQQGLDRLGDRLAVLEAFLGSEGHLTAQSWHGRLLEKGKNLEIGFVEATLEMFTRYGLATRRDFQGQPPRYEHRHLGEHHDHLICTVCGSITEFHRQDLEEHKARAAREMGFHALSHRLQIYGLCELCRADREPSMPLGLAACGERVRVERLVGGEKVGRQLAGLGIQVGTELEVISFNGGPMVVAHGGNRVALGRGVASKVMVTPLDHKARALR